MAPTDEVLRKLAQLLDGLEMSDDLEKLGWEVVMAGSELRMLVAGLTTGRAKQQTIAGFGTSVGPSSYGLSPVLESRSDPDSGESSGARLQPSDSLNDASENAESGLPERSLREQDSANDGESGVLERKRTQTEQVETQPGLPSPARMGWAGSRQFLGRAPMHAASEVLMQDLSNEDT